MHVTENDLQRLQLREEQRGELWDGAVPGASYVTWDAVQAAAFLHIHVDTLYHLARLGVVPGCKLGRAWVFVPHQLAEYVERRCLTGSARAAATPAKEDRWLAARLDARLAARLDAQRAATTSRAQRARVRGRFATDKR